MKRLLILLMPIVLFFAIHMFKVHPISQMSFKDSVQSTADELVSVGDDVLASTYDMYCMWSGQKMEDGSLMRYWNGVPVKDGENPVCTKWPR